LPIIQYVKIEVKEAARWRENYDNITYISPDIKSINPIQTKLSFPPLKRDNGNLDYSF